MNRREFLSTMTWGAALAGAGSVVAAITRFMQPVVETGAPGPAAAGLPSVYAIGSLTFVEGARAYLGRDEDGFYALLATCTHLGCTPRLEADGFACPCHGSRFARSGAVINGPATRPLDRVLVGISPDGQLFIDPGRPVSSDFRLRVAYSS
ncbi:MAG: ubiquinol-cytochrome c reductase iron-sulfur subunit [Rudaea sp.]